MGEDFGFLRLLTYDFFKLNYIQQDMYPAFYTTVIRPSELKFPGNDSRQAYLKQNATHDLSDQVMAYWKANLQTMVPDPKSAHKSDYTLHAQWVGVLRELAPDHYIALLDQWRTEHHRRRNLWKALAQLGLA